VNPTPLLEETQQPALEGTKIDRLTEVQEQQNQNTKTLKEAQPKNSEAAPKVDGTVTNQEE
jgi:hypothetical protein